MQVNQIAAAAFIMAELCLTDMALAGGQCISGCTLTSQCQDACIYGGYTDLPAPTNCPPCKKPMAGYDEWAFCCGVRKDVVLEPRCRPIQDCKPGGDEPDRPTYRVTWQKAQTVIARD